jgi:hypothetical protein
VIGHQAVADAREGTAILGLGRGFEVGDAVVVLSQDITAAGAAMEDLIDETVIDGARSASYDSKRGPELSPSFSLRSTMESEPDSHSRRPWSTVVGKCAGRWVSIGEAFRSSQTAANIPTAEMTMPRVPTDPRPRPTITTPTWLAAAARTLNHSDSR